MRIEIDDGEHGYQANVFKASDDTIAWKCGYFTTLPEALAYARELFRGEADWKGFRCNGCWRDLNCFPRRCLGQKGHEENCQQVSEKIWDAMPSYCQAAEHCGSCSFFGPGKGCDRHIDRPKPEPPCDHDWVPHCAICSKCGEATDRPVRDREA